MSPLIRTTPFGHILCWVDGSDEACRAAQSAARLAKSLEAKLSFLAIGDETEFGDGMADYMRIEGITDPMSPNVANHVNACLKQAISEAVDVGIVAAAGLIKVGDPVDAICDATKAQGADLVVIRRRKSNIVQRLLGASVQDTLANECGFAVLSVG